MVSQRERAVQVGEPVTGCPGWCPAGGGWSPSVQVLRRCRAACGRKMAERFLLEHEELTRCNKKYRVGCSIVTMRATEQSGTGRKVELVFYAVEVDW